MFKKRYIKWVLLAFILVYIGAATIPYIPHKEVNETYKTSIQQTAFYADKTGTERVDYIDDNTDALLYRLHMIEEAQNEIIIILRLILMRMMQEGYDGSFCCMQHKEMSK